MDTLSDAFGVPVGCSDHCLGDDVSLAAVARGAAIARAAPDASTARFPGPDHAMSLEPDELAVISSPGIRVVERALGDGVKRPQPSELETRAVARRSIVAVRSMEQASRSMRTRSPSSVPAEASARRRSTA